MNNEVNFIKPIPPQQQEAVARWLTISAVGSCCLAGALCLFSAYTLYQIACLKGDHNRQQIVEQTKVAQKKLETLQTLHDHLQKQTLLLKQHNASSKDATCFLQEISDLILPDIALLQYKQSPGTLELEGHAYKTDSILAFARTLNRSPYFKNVHIRSMHQEPAQKETSLVQFTLKGTTKQAHEKNQTIATARSTENSSR